MKIKILSSIVVASFLLIGCSSKEGSMNLIQAEKEVDFPKASLKIQESLGASKIIEPRSITKAPYIPSPKKSVNLNQTETIDIIAVDVIKEPAPENIKGINGLNIIYFDYDQFAITEESVPALLENIKLLHNKFVRIEGNCDEFGTDEYNFALGLKRANAIKKFIILHGYNKNNISLVSYGESNPKCMEQTKECFSKNRRVEFVIQ